MLSVPPKAAMKLCVTIGDSPKVCNYIVLAFFGENSVMIMIMLSLKLPFLMVEINR